MWFFTAVASAFLFGCAGFLMKVSQMKKGAAAPMLFALYVTGTIGFWVTGLYEDSGGAGDWRVWAGGLFIAVGSAGGNYLFMKALEHGPASLTSPLVNMNIVLVILMSVAVYGESPGPWQWLGIVLLLSAVALIAWRRGEPLSISEKTWFVLVGSAILVFTFRNGGLKVTDAIGLENTAVLMTGYLLAALWFAPAALKPFLTGPDGKNVATEKEDRSTRTGLAWGSLAGAFSFAGMQLYAAALHLGPASVVAPLFATNSLVVTIGSIWLFGERLNPAQKAALVCLFAGLAAVRL